MMVDNCCSVSKKLKDMFGPQLTVKLDVFHAVSRFTCTILKKYPLQQSRSREYGCVFRFNNDLGVNQFKSIPPVNTITQNYKNFKLKWDDEIVKFNVTAKQEMH